MPKEFELENQLRQDPTRVSIADFRFNQTDILNQVAYQNKIILVQRHGRDLVAVVPIEALNRLIETALSAAIPQTQEPEQTLPL